jgi:hypothetical protein
MLDTDLPADDKNAQDAFNELTAESAALRAKFVLEMEKLATREAEHGVIQQAMIATIKKNEEANDWRLSTLEKRIAELASRPALKQTPDDYAAHLDILRANAVTDVRAAWAEPTRHANTEWTELVKLTKTMRDRSDQNWLLASVAGIMLVVGFAAYPIIGRTTPWSSRMAAWTTTEPQMWNAGIQLMQEANPSGMNEIEGSLTLVRSNAAALKACRDAPVVPGKKVMCSLVLPDIPQ